MKGDHVAVRNTLVQVEGHGIGAPGIPAKAQQQRSALPRADRGWDVHAHKPIAAGRLNLNLDTYGGGFTARALIFLTFWLISV
jgi:hypothetical protein